METLGNLATASKENLVYAINEIKGALSSFVKKKDIVDNLTTESKKCLHKREYGSGIKQIYRFGKR